MLDLTWLTGQRRAIVIGPDGPRLVQAGPGTGKTTLIAARVAYLVAVRGVDPASILAISFTRVAAAQLRERLHRVLGRQAKDAEVVTCHALGLRIVRQWQEDLGFGDRPLAVYDQYEARQALREAAQQCDIDFKRLALEDLAREVDGFRLDGSCSLELSLVRPVAAAYEAHLQRRGALDFPAMLALPLRLFKHSPRALQLYRDAYRHVFVDELQDIAPAQYELLRQLALQHQNLFAVGDLTQTLYAYRGAGAGIFRRFQGDFPKAQVVPLDENFRSTGEIVRLGNRLVQPLSYARPLRTHNPDGPPPCVYEAADERAEAAFVAGELLRLLDRGLVASPGEAAVLYRTNAQAGELIVVFRQAGIPYRVAGDGELFGHTEIQYVLAYLRLAVNLADGLALARIINVPPRRLARLAQKVAMDPCGTTDLASMAEAFGPTARAAAMALAQLLHELHSAASNLSPTAVLDAVLDWTGFAEWLGGLADAEPRLGRLAALRSLLEEATDGLAAWLDDLALTPGLEPVHNQANAVLLATVHRAKGLEWPVVFIVGLEQGLLPHAHALDVTGPAGLEEELRVAYVAMTRARERIYLSYCRRRRRGDLTEPRQPSQFLNALSSDAWRRVA